MVDTSPARAYTSWWQARSDAWSRLEEASRQHGAVPLREIKSRLLALRAAGKLDRVKLLMLTNCTFDGIVYDAGRVMEECLAIRPDLVFLWDEAWFAFARFHPVYRPRTAMRAARTLADGSGHRSTAPNTPGMWRSWPTATRPCWSAACCPTRPGPGYGCTPPSPRTRR
jgi:hypothetical protein